jgi:hypothetical protein
MDEEDPLMDLLNLIKNQLNTPDVLKNLSQTVGADTSQISKLTQLGLPALLEGLTRNTKTQEGAESLANALDQHKDDAVDDLSGFFSQVDTNDGQKILRHVFGDNGSRVQNNLARKTGLDTSQVSGILSRLAPMLLGTLGKQKQEQGLDAGGIASLLPSLSGLLGQGGGLANIAQLLDPDKDGDILDDVKGFLGKLFK